MISDQDLEKIFSTTAVSIISYSENIITLSNSLDDADVLSWSDLFFDLTKEANQPYEEVLQIFSNYYDTMYSHMRVFQDKERYEAANLIKKAMKIEVDYVLSYVVKHLPEIKKDLKRLEPMFKAYYLL